MSDVPTEVIFEILCCLPVKSLLKFRCVCKSWKTLIDNPRFVKMHLNHSFELKSANVNAKLILCGDSSLCYVSFESLNTRIDAHSTTLNYPLKDDARRTLVLGYCNGLLLISHCMFFLLWNPSTRKYCKLPYVEPKKHPPGTFYQWSGGFGYDRTADDYKVVRVIQASGNEQNYAETLVYSLKSNSWRRTKEFPLWISQNEGAIFVFGALHWVVFVPTEVDDECMIVSFDLGSEAYELVPLPQHLAAPERVDLGVLDGCLSMSCNYKSERVDIWLMRDRGKNESWSKLLSLDQVDVISSLKENIKPISYSWSGTVILEKDKELLLLYDLERKSVRVIPILRGPSTFSTSLYLESLVQLEHKGCEEVSKKMDQAKEKQKKPKKRDDFLSTGFKLKL